LRSFGIYNCPRLEMSNTSLAQLFRRKGDQMPQQPPQDPQRKGDEQQDGGRDQRARRDRMQQQQQGQHTGTPVIPQRDPPSPAMTPGTQGDPPLVHPGDQPDILPDVIADGGPQSPDGGTGSRQNHPSGKLRGDQSGIGRPNDASSATPDRR
jgi:hypothetical protein